ncbi:hypothetical protein Hdeb2414_s0006g00224821 [Helianthus debilis subsp. tardiflorus]
MGDNSDDEVVEVSRDEYLHKLDEAIRKDYGFMFSHEEPNVHQDLCIQEQNAITIKEGLGEPSNVKQHDVYCTSKGVIAGGSPSLTKDRLPVLVSKRAGFTKNLHTLKFENLQG